MKMTVLVSLVLLGLSGMAEAKTVFVCHGGVNTFHPHSTTVTVVTGLAEVVFEDGSLDSPLVFIGPIEEKESGVNTTVFEANLKSAQSKGAFLTLSETKGSFSKLPGTCRARWCPGDDDSFSLPVIKASLKINGSSELFYGACSKTWTED